MDYRPWNPASTCLDYILSRWSQNILLPLPLSYVSSLPFSLLPMFILSPFLSPLLTPLSYFNICFPALPHREGEIVPTREHG